MELLQCIAAPPRVSGHCNSCNTLPYCVGGSGQRNSCNATASLPGGSGQWKSCNALLHRLGAAGNGTPATDCSTAWGQCTASLAGGKWAVKPLQHNASLLGRSGQWISCNTLPHCMGVVGSATPALHCPTAWGAASIGTRAMHCLTAWGQLAAELLQCTTSLPGGSGLWNCCNAPPHCLGGSGR